MRQHAGMLAIALGLGSAACWGLADFVGGVQSRRVPVAAVMLVSQATGLVVVLLLVAASGERSPGFPALAPAALAGVGGAVALSAFYRALAIGTMSIVAPISATGAAVPVVVGLATGDRPGALQLAGIGAAAVGVVLASRERHEEAERAAAGRTSIGLALFAALGFGSFFVGMDAAADDSILWALLTARAATVAAVLAAATVLRPELPDRPRALAWLAGIGVCDLAANGLYAAASTEGLLSVVAVLGSLYPVATILLARAILRERIRPVQAAGVVVALAGVVLIAGG
jgi:drug/metabolite transporter (DMT)-like permease